ncbi:hypothetical protein K1719_012287 [Acacia pycnantha]|nr:hypothetical protein K1719_012287 [Acacia pycnantha]
MKMIPMSLPSSSSSSVFTNYPLISAIVGFAIAQYDLFAMVIHRAMQRLQGKSSVIQDKLVRLGDKMATIAGGTRAIALELCREFEDKFLQHINTGEGAGWKIVASFEGNFPNRMKQLPLDRHFDINNVKRIVLEADGYQPYLISPEKGLRSLIKVIFGFDYF